MTPDRLLAHYGRIADAPDAIARVRRFVLNLAVRGKLVAQKSTDGTPALGDVDKAPFGDSPDAARRDSKLISVMEVTFGPRSVERRGMGVLRTVCH